MQNFLADAGLKFIHKEKKSKERLSSITGSEITLTNNEIKNVIKVISSLEKRGTLFKGTTKNLPLKKKDFSIFLDH